MTIYRVNVCKITPKKLSEVEQGVIRCILDKMREWNSILALQGKNYPKYSCDHFSNWKIHTDYEYGQNWIRFKLWLLAELKQFKNVSRMWSIVADTMNVGVGTLSKNASIVLGNNLRNGCSQILLKNDDFTTATKTYHYNFTQGIRFSSSSEGMQLDLVEFGVIKFSIV